MEVVIIFLYVFLIVIGAISIISSLVSLSSNISESDSSVETKWFKWKAPVRLVFGLVCIISVIAINKYDFWTIDKTKLLELQKKNEELVRENNFLKEKCNVKDSINNPYFLSIENKTGTSFSKGKVLISNYYRQLTIRGAEAFSENLEKIKMDKFQVETGQKYYIKVEGKFWGMNILEADINNDNIVKIQIYEENNSLTIK
jgi:hypothetical protein